MDLQKSGYISVFWHAETESEAYLCLKLEGSSEKKTFHFLTIDPWWKNVNFSLCKSIIGMILVFQMLTNKYRKKSKKTNFKDILTTKDFINVLVSGGRVTPVWCATYVK